MQHKLIRRAVLLALCCLAGAAQAGRVTLFSYNGGGNLADLSADDTVSVSRAGGYAASHQYGGGVGVFASAISQHINMQAQATARSITTFTVSCPLDAFDGLSCGLDFSMLVSGSASASSQHDSQNTLAYGTAEAGFLMQWTVASSSGSVSGGGEVHRYAHDDGSHSELIIGQPFSSHQLFYVNNGSQVTIVLQASAGAFTDNTGSGGASAVADFEHTLRWGGINAAYSADGRALDLSQLHLLGSDGYDYVKAAPPNPYITAVPEPASAAMLALGLVAVIGGCKRRRRRRELQCS